MTMKNIIALLLIALPSIVMAQDQATVYIFRDTGFAGSAMNTPINIDDEKCKLGNNEFYKIEIDPGTYFLSTHKAKNPIKIKLDSGTYYFDLDLKIGILSGRFVLEEITERGAQKYFENEKMKLVDGCFD